MRTVEVVPYDPAWQAAFETESTQIAAALGPTIVKIHHIGSISIPGIYAKPIIDLLVEVAAIGRGDEYIAVYTQRMASESP